MGVKFKDERIEKRANEIYAKLYILILALTIVGAIFKWFFLTQSIIDYMLEIIALVGSSGYLLIKTSIAKIPLFESPDDCIKEIQNSYRKTCFNICFQTYIFGELIVLFILNKSTIACVYIIDWSIPSLIYTFIAIRQGLLVWGSRKLKVSRIKSFKVHTVITSILFGMLTGWKFLFNNNSFNSRGVFFVLIAAIAWGIPFYFIMKYIINKSEKIADKQLMVDEDEKN